jgi:hypothetical protein
MSVADNQVANVNAWVRLGFLESIPVKNDFDVSSFLLNSLQHLHDFSIRQSRALIGKQLIDGKGALNAVDKVLEYAQ